MNYQQKLENLKRYAKMETEEDMKLFEITLKDFLVNKDHKVLEELIEIFDDNCENPEIMHNLVQVIENYPPEIYVEVLSYKIKDFKKYPEWFTLLLYHIFNSAIHLELLKKHIHLADRDKLLELLDIMYQESEVHRPVIDELRKLINKERE